MRCFTCGVCTAGLTEHGRIDRYEKFHNYTNGFDDFVATFQQRLQEQDAVLAGRFELFMEVISGSGSRWDTITNTVQGTAVVLDGLWEGLQAQMIQILTTLPSSPPKALDDAEHRL